MFAGTASGVVYCWQTYTGALLRSWTGHFGPVTSIRTSSNDMYLFTASEDTTVKQYFLPSVFDPKTVVPVPEHTFSGHAGKVTDFALGGEDLLISGSEDNSVKFFSLESKSQIDQILLPAPVVKLACTHVGGVVVACSDGSVFTHSTTQGGEALRLLAKHATAVSGVGLSTDCARAITCAADGVKIWDLRSRVLIMTVLGPNQQLKDSLNLTVVRKPVIVPDLVALELEKTGVQKKLVLGIDAYLQLKPLQRTLTPVESIDVIPLIRMWAAGPVPKVKNGVCIDAKSLEGGIPQDPLQKAQSDVAKLKELNKTWATTCADLAARLSAFTGTIELSLRVPSATTEEATNGVAPRSGSKKRKSGK